MAVAATTMYGAPTAATWLFDTFFGGAGNDRIFDASNAATVTATLACYDRRHHGVGQRHAARRQRQRRVLRPWHHNTLYAYGGDGDDWFVWRHHLGDLAVDIVDGGAGDDVISVFNGNDTAYGGSGTDVIWGGGGSDTLYGGDDVDYLYGGEGNNVLAGGNGADWYHVSKGDGPTTLIDTGARDNNLVLFGQFDTSGNQLFIDGTGVNETPNNGAGTPLTAGAVLGSSAGGEIDLSINGTSALLSVAGGSTVQFSTADIATITLWNNDASAGHVQEVFNWNAAAGTYVFAGYF